MTKEQLFYHLTGTETPIRITERENAIIDKCLVLINQRKQSDKQSVKQMLVLNKLVESFSELENDEPINGSAAVDILCGMWPEIKDAIK